MIQVPRLVRRGAINRISPIVTRNAFWVKSFRLSLAAILFYPMISLGINPASSGSTTISLFDLLLP
jgi:hypothetical protein